MKSGEIIVETKDGAVIQINYGCTYAMDDGCEITYEQMMGWLLNGTLNQHGFYPYKIRAYGSRKSNNLAVRTSHNLLTVASMAGLK